MDFSEARMGLEVRSLQQFKPDVTPGTAKANRERELLRCAASEVKSLDDGRTDFDIELNESRAREVGLCQFELTRNSVLRPPLDRDRNQKRLPVLALTTPL